MWYSPGTGQQLGSEISILGVSENWLEGAVADQSQSWGQSCSKLDRRFQRALGSQLFCDFFHRPLSYADWNNKCQILVLLTYTPIGGALMISWSDL